MLQTKFRTALILSIILAILMTIQSAGGLMVGNLYRDNNWVVSANRANDLFTLFIAVPVLVTALVLSSRGSPTATFVWLGMLYYELYQNMYYIFGAAFNLFFPIYVTIFALSTFILILGVSNIRIQPIANT